MFNHSLIRRLITHLRIPSAFSHLVAWLQDVLRCQFRHSSSLQAAAISRPVYCSNRSNSLSAEGPTVEILPTVFAKLWAYVEECPSEISGFGMVQTVEGNLVVSDVFITHQRSSSAATEISEDDLARFLNELLDKGEDTGQLRLYWHSHADMGVFFSGTDLQTMETAFHQADWVLGLVLNRRGEMKACLYLYQPVPIRLYELPVRLHLDPDLRGQVQEEIRNKVRQGYSAPTSYGVGRWSQPEPAYHRCHDGYGAGNQRTCQSAPEGIKGAVDREMERKAGDFEEEEEWTTHDN